MNTRRADLLLLTASTVWGFAFVAQRAGMEHLGPFAFNAIRFALGALVLGPFLWIARRRGALAPSRPGGLTAGLVAGAILFAGAALQQCGLVVTSATNAGFITGLYVVLVPVLGLAVGQSTHLSGWVGVTLGAIGLFLLSVTDDLTLRPGDLLVLLSAGVWAVHVLYLGKVAPGRDARSLAFIQFATCSALSAVTSWGWETTSMSSITAAWLPILYAGVVSVGIGYSLQVMAQQDVPPTRAAIIMSLEGVFAAVGGWWMLGEQLTPRGFIGCALMLAAALVAQLPARTSPSANSKSALP